MLKTVFENGHNFCIAKASLRLGGSILPLDRKDLVKAVEEFTKQRAEYMYAPSFAFKVGDYTINKDGSITSDFEMDSLKEFLVEKGFIQQENEPTKEILDENEQNHQENADGIEFSVPLDGADDTVLINFANMLYSYQYLINKALGMITLDIPTEFIENIPQNGLDFDMLTGFKVEDDKLVFTYPDTDGG